nr:MAG TPA_asm: hypothetical protein [Bacteriophage sp.]
MLHRIVVYAFHMYYYNSRIYQALLLFQVLCFVQNYL